MSRHDPFHSGWPWHCGALTPMLSAVATGTGNSSVFRHTLRVPDSHTFWRIEAQAD